MPHQVTNWRMQNNFLLDWKCYHDVFNKEKFWYLFLLGCARKFEGTRGFIDISGKNKRGLKLTFLWRSMTKNKFNKT